MDDVQYSFAAKPRPVQTTRAKYREKKPSNTVFNIMNDPRVARGSVYAAANSIHLKRDAAPPAPTAPPPTVPVKKNSIYEPPTSLSTYIPVDLTAFLVEQTPTIESLDVQTQTDAFLPNDKHKKPFVLKKTGIDASTEILEEDGLFNFDAEVQPLLNVLVNKTLQQARAEVERETELHHISLYLSDLHVKKRVEADGVAKLVEAAVAAQEAKERETTERAQRLAEMDILQQKVAALKVGHRLLDDAIANADAQLRKNGVFYDPLKRLVETGFMKWMYTQADAAVDAHLVTHALLDDLLEYSLHKQRILATLARLPTTGDGCLLLDARHVDLWNVPAVGPIAYSPRHTFAVIEAHIEAWLQGNESTAELPRPDGGYLQALFP
ncbi:hypothetical protein SPRG_08503 [Saprolegnia parasitica CBS 223.65]|uniref:Uncharacterized protein n=1 Tax=Saprolegnia parasitica (strain CBS 223.65) TaxID=695850 RepID=A0A067CH65_SAPPC|nr:hypothetical protein SPRG_08503 [Saprolegnia parasitica CBS 223.65]KDO26142.1 hypothetical protein SPRG_08503 [Saprolegnia parasitica CBS 223.65]|eukprot:XP_012203136.1 hypothetical protein SPRG_08503 [Saprolegnia parasitica CBS 223.65]